MASAAGKAGGRRGAGRAACDRHPGHPARGITKTLMDRDRGINRRRPSPAPLARAASHLSRGAGEVAGRSPAGEGMRHGPACPIGGPRCDQAASSERHARRPDFRLGRGPYLVTLCRGVMRHRTNRLAPAAGALCAGLLISALAGPGAASAAAPAGAVAPAGLAGPNPADAARTATPIKHLVVIYDENVSFDHYFATYPKAANPPGEPRVRRRCPARRAVDTLVAAHLLTQQPQLHQHGERRRRGRAVPARSHPGRHRRPEPRLHRRAAGL